MVIERDEYLKQIVGPLLGWFGENARSLPWREQPLPYYVWISEIMLQQTRVEAVKPYFLRFIQALPEIGALADCPEDKLLKLWEGLGYYNRVRNMQKAARIVMEEYGGSLPADYEELKKLPGIGSYTAGAIASIAYGLAAPAVDGNVLRVLSRIMESEEDITRQAVKTRMEETVMAILPRGCPGIFNQALMELGAMVCVPNGAPECGRCPVAELCQARIHDRLSEIPKKKEKAKRRQEDRTVLVIRDGIRTVIRKRPEKGLLAGLYELPNLEGTLAEEQVIDYLRENGLSPVRITPLPAAKHIFSHVEWHMTGYMVLVEQMEEAQTEMSQKGMARKRMLREEMLQTELSRKGIFQTEISLEEKKKKPGEAPFLVIEPERTESEYPIPAAFAAYVKYLKIRLGQDKFRAEE